MLIWERRLCVFVHVRVLHIYVLRSDFMLELLVMRQFYLQIRGLPKYFVDFFGFYIIMPLEGSIVEVKFSFSHVLTCKLFML